MAEVTDGCGDWLAGAENGRNRGSAPSPTSLGIGALDPDRAVPGGDVNQGAS